MLLPDVIGDPRLVSPMWREDLGLKSYYGVPITAGGELMGVLNVALSDCDEPTAEEREIVDLLASHAAVAIGNARLFAESETRRRAAEALSEVWRFLSETFDVAGLGQRIADVVLRALQVRAAALYRLVPASGDLEVIGRSGEAERFLDPGFVIPAGHGMVGLAVNRRQPVVTPDIRVDARVQRTPDMQVHHAICPSVLSLPMVVKGQVVGGFTVGDTLGRSYSDDDLRLAQTFADQAAVALENARLFEEAERRRWQSLALGAVSQTLAESLHPVAVAQRVVDSACRWRSSISSNRSRERSRRPRAPAVRPPASGRCGTRAAPGRSGSPRPSAGPSCPTTCCSTRGSPSPRTCAPTSSRARSARCWRCR
jgi:GAF domain-containing protein